jgi:hypothetical protein|tara:strand:+ start:751 stop:1530 length:780 start_codon:yes stop_codon:yes gene_type:complete
VEKYIITSGCSYSDVSMGAWPKHIDEFFPNVIVKNYGSCARGNDYISRTIISSVQKLLDDGVKPNNIFVLGCWSGLQRRDILINKESVKQHFSLSHHTKKQNELGFTNKLPIGEWEGFNEEWWKLISEEQGIIISLENILRTEWFLRDKKINYKFFSFVNIFVDSHYFEEWNPKYNTESNTKIIEKYPNTKYLWDMIDWDKWWFWKNYGGVGNWILENVKGGYDKDEIGGMLGHNHPTEKGHKEFAEKIVSIFINDTYN